MLKQSNGWIVRAVLSVVTMLPVCAFAQDTTVRDRESDSRQRHSRGNGRVVRDSDGIPHIAASTEREVISQNNSNGFMFRFAPSLRYVASLESDDIKSVSSLPGGESGDPSSPFYVNLLRPWLTNEAFPLRTDVVDVPLDRDDDGQDRDHHRDDHRDRHRDRDRR